MSECPPEKRIAEGVDGQLSKDDELALLAHIRSCDRCAAIFSDYAKIQSAFSVIESYDGKILRLKPSAILKRILLYKNGEPAEVADGDIDWKKGRTGHEIHVNVYSEGEYEVIFDDELASAKLTAKDLVPSGKLAASDAETAKTEEIASQPQGLFRLSWLSAHPAAPGRTIPAVLCIVFARNILEERRDE